MHSPHKIISSYHFSAKPEQKYDWRAFFTKWRHKWQQWDCYIMLMIFLYNFTEYTSAQNFGMKIIQLVEGGLAHQLAKYGANLLARFVFTTDWNFLEGKLNAGKITILRLYKLNWHYCKDLQRVLRSDSMKSLLSTRCIIIVFMHWASIAETYTGIA